jgi:Cytochrome b5-like Heme/Steroid binding domain
MENNYNNKNDKVAFSTIINKYPTFRDLVFKGCFTWLEGRQADDGAEGLWRVHNKLYDLKEFVNKHPGGKEWLIRTEV